MKVLVTGADGFIGKNLVAHLDKLPDVEILTFSKKNPLEDLTVLVAQADFIFHLAGVNRPKIEEEFYIGNSNLTQHLVDCIVKSGKKIPVVLSSSIQVANDSVYGQSKKSSEDALLQLYENSATPIAIYRLPNVFGKWCKPNYNSVVATFCHNVIHDKELQIHDPNALLHLVYIDDVIQSFITEIKKLSTSDSINIYQEVSPVYNITVGDLASVLKEFHTQRKNLHIENVGTGIQRALYATYISYVESNDFSYSVVKHEDTRGRFVEMLKTPTAGQFSYFTAHPGIVRGGHYHHTKTEKFLVIKGTALFKFRHLITDEYYELTTHGDDPRIVDTVTGWTHDITNIGNDELIVMLWANEVFDPTQPDTYAHPLEISRLKV